MEPLAAASHSSDIVLSTTEALQKDLLVKDEKRAQNHDDDIASIFSAANTSAVLVPSFAINLKHLFFRENCHGLVDKWGFLVSSKETLMMVMMVMMMMMMMMMLEMF